MNSYLVVTDTRSYNDPIQVDARTAREAARWVRAYFEPKRIVEIILQVSVPEELWG